MIPSERNCCRLLVKLNPPILTNLRVVLVRTRNPLNIGAVARAMSNFGFSQLRLVNPYELAFREARSAVGASEILAGAQEYKTIADAVADCGLVIGATAIGGREVQHPLKRLEEAAEVARTETSGVALLFGSEKVGLSNDDLSYCHWLLRIPTAGDHRSMNLGQAVAICLYELVRQPGPISEPRQAETATAAELERMTAVLTEALHACGYMTDEATRTTEEKTRRLIRRLNLSSADALLLLGMLRQISRKFG
jgi:tRNA/rRNA methyltransferase